MIMIYDFIAIGIIVICIVIIVIIITKKFPILASINISILQKYKQDKIKKGLIEDRLKRKFKAFSVRNLFKSGSEKPKSPLFENFYKYLKILEKRYKDGIKTREPEEKETAEKKKIILLSEAKVLFEGEKFKEAEDKYIEAISLDNKYIEAYEGLAETYLKIKDFEHAKEIYGYLIKMNARDSSKEEDQERVDSKEGINEKEKGYSQSTSLSNQVARYQVDLGEVFMATEEYEKALGCFQEAVKLEPNNPRNLDAIIEVAIKLENKALAVQYYNKLKEVNPENEKLEGISRMIETSEKK